ncbi:MAG: ABC transporter permease [Candidatus Geothermarchaeales archaeon]
MSERLWSTLRSVISPVVAIAVALIVGALLMLSFGFDPIRGYVALFRGSFGSIDGWMETLAFSTPLMVTAITFAVGMRAGLFNIGAEGQVYMGAAGAIAVGGMVSLPPGLHLVAATAAAMLVGGLWALPAALLKMWRGVHEVVSTIMFNWIAFWFVTYLIRYHITDPDRAERATPAMITARYPILGGSLTGVIFVIIAFCVAIYFLLWHTGLGYELRLAGDNPDAARYAGVSFRRVILLTFLIGGLAAGLAGGSQILGRPPSWTVYATLGNLLNLGFQGIGVALIGRNHPIGAIFAAVFFGGLAHGGRFMEYEVGVSAEMVGAINGIIVIALALPEILRIVKRVRTVKE